MAPWHRCTKVSVKGVPFCFSWYWSLLSKEDAVNNLPMNICMILLSTNSGCNNLSNLAKASHCQQHFFLLPEIIYYGKIPIFLQIHLIFPTSTTKIQRTLNVLKSLSCRRSTPLYVSKIRSWKYKYSSVACFAYDLWSFAKLAFNLHEIWWKK